MGLSAVHSKMGKDFLEEERDRDCLQLLFSPFIMVLVHRCWHMHLSECSLQAWVNTC